MTDVMYLLTNEKGEWPDQLLVALKMDGWPTIRTSRDLLMETVEQKEVAMAIDMEIARRAAVFVGNGVCFLLLVEVSMLMLLSSSHLLRVALCIAAWSMAKIQLASGLLSAPS